MDRRTSSGMEVVKVLVNTGGFQWRRTTGDRARLYDEHPTNETDRRHVTGPLHDELRTGTLRDIAESAGANDLRRVLRVDRPERLRDDQRWSRRLGVEYRIGFGACAE